MTTNAATMPTPDQELAALQAQLKAKSAAREAATSSAKQAAAIARAKRDLEDFDTFAALEDEHAPTPLGRVNTPHGMVVVKAPVGIVYQRLVDELARSEHANPKVRTSAAQAIEKAASNCVVHPPRAEFVALAEKVVTLSSVVVNMAVDLGKAEAVEEAGK